MATAIPPKAAELASKRLARQRFWRCCGGTEALDGSVDLTGMGDRNGMGMDNLRKGMDDLIRKMYGRGVLRETFLRNLRLCYCKGRS
jgi:hypothetical protein